MLAEIGNGDEDDDGKISHRGNCGWVIASGFGTEHCSQAHVRHEELREIAISRGRVRQFS
jgi:hypothetical protein